MATIVISFREVDEDVHEQLREHLDKGCQRLAAEFPETTHFEITLAADGGGLTAHGHVTGSHTEAAGHGEADDPRAAADQCLDALGRQLRKHHDKKIFGHRREARRANERRRSG